MIEWGFVVGLLPQVQALIERGIEAWWFDGDPEACLAGWQEEHPSADVRLWHNQVADIRANWPALASTFANHIVTTASPGGIRLPFEQIAALMRLTSVPYCLELDALQQRHPFRRRRAVGNAARLLNLG